MINYQIQLGLLIAVFVFGASNLTGYASLETDQQDSHAIFTEANAQFEQANTKALTNPAEAQELYQESILNYQSLVDHQNVQAVGLHTNLGNAYFLSGDHGRAVLNYQRALAIDPLDADVSHNLEYIRSLTVDELPATRSQQMRHFLSFWHRWSFSARVSILALANISLWGLLACLFYKRSRWLYGSITGVALVTIIFTLSLWVSYKGLDNSVDAVVVEKEVVARQGNGYIYDNAFTSPLHSGTELTILERRDDWYHAELLDGTTCWLTVQSVERIDVQKNIN
jgi:hypothetical protein